MSDIDALLLPGPMDAAALMARLGVSQATLSRLISAQPQVLKYGRARATRYALLRPLRGESSFPLWQVDEQGRANRAGQLYSVWPAGSCVVQQRDGSWQHFAGLPWYLSDMRPQGFLGRAWGRECARQLDLPEDVRQWSDEHLLMALTSYGSDLSGNWLAGQQSYQRWLQQPEPEPVTRQEKAEAWPLLAQKVLAGEEIGSSAGGEQPKFTCYAEQHSGERAHLLVKFTPAQRNANSQRWCDLLKAEALALQLLAGAGMAAAEASITTLESGQVFLEVVRFDRAGAHGRRGLVSLEAVQAEFCGAQQRWPQALQALLAQKKISSEDAARGTLQWAFGRLIANGDMHSGNLAFFPTSPRLTLTPAYDMLPMSLAPNSAGFMRDTVPVIALDASVSGTLWRRAMPLAQRYWQTIADSDAWSEGFRQLAGDMQQTLKALLPQIERMA
ncbi:type II toxin-antitoxin system HipA family toxin YjjJ [Erwinia mallotivora]|uniref:type II toxin-antitoxin system HipA family toxin YjjJ n=1 Tax=Erwinia mallotivora TaxID=69222 RepID=UPI0021C1226B|nr:type II toxin-antitoxin system HipA family toxin YjjJ [Erwinia mallotivora]